VIADLPGVEQQALDVRVVDGVLTLQGNTKHIAPGTPIAREYELLNFYRQFELRMRWMRTGYRPQLKHGVLASIYEEREGQAKTNQRPGKLTRALPCGGRLVVGTGGRSLSLFTVPCTL